MDQTLKQRSLSKLASALALSGLCACHDSGPTVAPPPPSHPYITSERTLLQRPGCEEFPQPTRDGRYLYFDGSFESGFSVMRLELATGQVERLTQAEDGIWDYSNEWNYGVALSPDDQTVAYLHDGVNGTELRTIRSGEEPQVLGAVTDTEPAWLDATHVLAISPDQQLFSFASDMSAPPTQLLPAVEGLTPFGMIRLDERRALVRMSRDNSGETSWSLLLGDWRTEQECGGSKCSGYQKISRPVEHGLRFKTGEASGHPGWVYYVHGDVYDNAQLVLAASDGSRELPIATEQRVVGGFARSADRKRLYYSTCYGYEGVAVAKPKSLPRSIFQERPDVRMAHARVIDGTDTLLMIADGKQRRQLAVLSSSENQATLTPLSAYGDEPAHQNGWVTFVDDEHGGIRIMPLSWPEEVRELTSEAQDHAPRLTPDQLQVLFLRGAEVGRQLWAVDVLSKRSRLLSEQQVSLFALSPDGKFVVALSYPEQQLLIASLPSSSSRSSKLRFRALRSEPIRGTVQDLRVSRDSRQILVVRLQREVLGFSLQQATHPELLVQGGFVGITEVDERPNGDLVLSTRSWDGDLRVAEGEFP